MEVSDADIDVADEEDAGRSTTASAANRRNAEGSNEKRLEGPEVKEAAPEVKEAAPEVKEAAPEVKEAAPEVKEAAPDGGNPQEEEEEEEKAPNDESKP